MKLTDIVEQYDGAKKHQLLTLLQDATLREMLITVIQQQGDAAQRLSLPETMEYADLVRFVLDYKTCIIRRDTIKEFIELTRRLENELLNDVED